MNEVDEIEEAKLKWISGLNGYMTTLSGIKLDICNPTEDMICIEDIAVGLANKGYFSGQTPKYYSVAKHSIFVLELLKEGEFAKGNTISINKMLLALMHDSTEGYLIDCIKPLKVMLPKFQEIENNLNKVIMKKFGLWEEYEESYKTDIKSYDLEAQIRCYNTFYDKTIRKFPRLGYYSSSPERDYLEFLQKFKELNDMR